MFSATCGLLPGSLERPDIVNLTRTVNSRGGYQKETFSMTCKLNRLGYLPVVSTISGLGRALLGLIHTIVHLVCSIFDRQHREEHRREASLGARNIVRGLVEAIPLLGNLTMIIMDEIRKHRFTDTELRRVTPNNQNRLLLSAYGEELGQKTIDEFEQAIENLNNISIETQLRIIAHPNKLIFTT